MMDTRNRLTALMCQQSCTLQEAIEMSRLMLLVQSDVLKSFKVFLDNAKADEERTKPRIQVARVMPK